MSLCLAPCMVPSKIFHLDYSAGRRKKFCHWLSVPNHMLRLPTSALSVSFVHQFHQTFFGQNVKRRLSCFIAQSTVTAITELHPSPSTTAGTVHQEGLTRIATTTSSTFYSCQVRSPSQDISPSFYTLDGVLVLRSIRNRIIPSKLSEWQKLGEMLASASPNSP